MVFAGQKQLMKLKEVNFINVTRYDELSVKNCYDKFMTMPGFKEYVPDAYPKGRVCDRAYMFNIAHTLFPSLVQQLIEYALNQRHAVDSERHKDDKIMMSEHWRQELKSLPMNRTVSDFF